MSTIFGNNSLNTITIGSAQIGIIVETLNTIESRVPTEGVAPIKQVIFIKKNYCTSNIIAILYYKNC